MDVHDREGGAPGRALFKIPKYRRNRCFDFRSGMNYFDPMTHESKERNTRSLIGATVFAFLLLPLLTGPVNAYPKLDQFPDSVRANHADSVLLPPEAMRLFQRVEEGIRHDRTQSFVEDLAPQVYIDLQESEGGYYSANQARSVLQSFFANRKLVNFKISDTGQSESTPYATGGGGLVKAGVYRHVQVYVSLVFIADRWLMPALTELSSAWQAGQTAPAMKRLPVMDTGRCDATGLRWRAPGRESPRTTPWVRRCHPAPESRF